MADIINQVPLTAGEMAVQQAAIDRQRKIAEYLQQQSLTPNEGQMISGRYVAPSWTQNIAKIAQGLMGNSRQKELDAQQMKIATQQGDVERSQYGIPSSVAAATPSASQGVPSSPGSAAQLDQSVPQPVAAVNEKLAATLQQQNSQAPNRTNGNMLIDGMNPYTAFSLGTNPKTQAAYTSAYLKQFEPTDVMRNDKYRSISPEQSRAFEIAKLTKEGTQSLQPGQTNILPNGDKLVAPQFDKGIAGGFDANGKPTLNKIAGSNVLSELAGETKRAEAAGTAGYNMTTVNTQNGPVMMTAEQAAKLSGGIPQDNNKIEFTGSNGVKLNFNGMTPQQLYDKIESTKNPVAKQDMQQAFSEWMANGQKPQQAGIKLEDPVEQKRKEMSLGINKDTLAGLVKDADSQKGILNTLDTVESIIKQGTLGNTPVDRLQMLAHNSGMKQTPETIRTANLEKLGNQLVLARGSLGSGVSSADAERYDKAAGDLSKAKSNDERLNYINIMRDIAARSFENTNNAFKSFNETGALPAYGSKNNSPVKISGDADYMKLPSGASYIAPDGTTRTKK